MMVSSALIKLVIYSLLTVGLAYLSLRYHAQLSLALKEYAPWLSKCPFHMLWKKSESSATDQPPLRLIELEELEAHGSSSEKIYLAILGRVFDVTKGRKHYGVDGGYNFFAGIDGSRAFVTGDFTKEGLVDDIADFDPYKCSELKHWTEFYHENYIYLGRLHGRFYDANGVPTAALDAFTKCAAAGEEEKHAADLDRIKYPPCNSRWSKADGGYVSCAPGSGGVERKWSGVPRQYYKPGSDDPRCACIRTNGISGEGTDTGDKGDLDNPHFKVYSGCDPMAVECKIS